MALAIVHVLRGRGEIEPAELAAAFAANDAADPYRGYGCGMTVLRIWPEQVWRTRNRELSVRSKHGSLVLSGRSKRGETGYARALHRGADPDRPG